MFTSQPYNLFKSSIPQPSQLQQQPNNSSYIYYKLTDHLINCFSTRYSREEYKCSMCPYTCTTEKAFLKHSRNCEPKDENDCEHRLLNLSCPICGKDRTGEELLALHMKKHKENKHFCCDICKFKTLQLKKVIFYSKMFFCDYYFLIIFNQLIQHRRMHTGEKPHLCPFCSYRSARRDNLRSHARRVHKKENLPCDTFTPRSMILRPSKSK